MDSWGKFYKIITRRKVLDSVSAQESQLSRVLNTFDLTALGVGSTLGVGVYVIAGKVAKESAGPAVILSFLIAAVASIFAGLCYAEFAARAPRAGSAYIYSYVCVGELIAFIVGWNLILEYVIGSASVARGLSSYLDSLLNDTMKHAFIDIAPMHVSFLAEYFDFFALAISVSLAAALAFGMKESSIVNNVITLLNIGVVLFVIIAGSTKANIKNWSITPNATTTNIGKGGFFPYGIEGMITGAATCFYGFVGFDCIATTGEEVKNPKRAIPISIILSLMIIFLSYFGTSTVVTLMVPYYEQDINVPIPHAFEVVGWDWAKWVVAIGGICGLCASLFGAMFPLPRIIYAMASDSLIFRFLGKVSPRFQTPVIGTILSGFLTGLMAALFELKQLVDMMSIGTLLAYTIVAASVLLLRYEKSEKSQYIPVRVTSDSDDSDTAYTENRMSTNNIVDSDEDFLVNNENVTCCKIFKQIFNIGRHKIPTKASQTVATLMVFLYCISCLGLGLCAVFLRQPIANGEIWAISITSVITFIAVVVIMSLVTQPTSKETLSFKVPLLPLIPALSILINVYLMLMLDPMTWIRFGIWMAIGLPMYFYSTKSNDNNVIKTQIHDNQCYTNGEKQFETTEKIQTVKNAVEILKELDTILENEENKTSSIRDQNSKILDTINNKVVVDVHKEKCTEDFLDNTMENTSEIMSNFDNMLENEERTIQIENLRSKIDLHQEKNSDSNNTSQILKNLDVMLENEEKNINIDNLGDEIIEDIHQENKNNNETIPNNLDCSIPPPPPPLPSPNLTLKIPEKIIEESGSSPEIEKIKIPRPKLDLTVSSLATVKLRPLIKRESLKPHVKTEMDNDNLTKDSLEYKIFREKLNKTLINNNNNIIKPVKRAESFSSHNKVKVIPNENVISDNIDRKSAAESLKLFFERNDLVLSFHENRLNSPDLEKENSSSSSSSPELEKENNINSANLQKLENGNSIRSLDLEEENMINTTNLEGDNTIENSENSNINFSDSANENGNSIRSPDLEKDNNINHRNLEEGNALENLENSNSINLPDLENGNINSLNFTNLGKGDLEDLQNKSEENYINLNKTPLRIPTKEDCENSLCSFDLETLNSHRSDIQENDNQQKSVIKQNGDIKHAKDDIIE